MNTLTIYLSIGLLAIASLMHCSEASADDANQKATEAKVRESFQEQMKQQEARIAAAEAKLQRIKDQFEKRMANAEQIIQKHAAMLAEKAPTTQDDDSDVPAAVLSAEGWKAWQQQDWRAALKKFELAVKKDPKAANTVNGLGWTYLHLGEYDKAIAAFDKTLVLDPTHGGALNGIGQSLMAQGKNDEAEAKLIEATEAVIAQYGEAKTVKNGVTASWLGLVRLYLATGDNEAAAEWAKRYLKHKPEDAMMKEMLEQAQKFR